MPVVADPRALDARAVHGQARRRWRRGTGAAEEQPGQDGAVAGGPVDGDDDRATRGDADRGVDPGALDERGGQVGDPRAAPVVDRDVLVAVAAVGVPVDGVQVERPAVGVRERQADLHLVGAVERLRPALGPGRVGQGPDIGRRRDPRRAGTRDERVGHPGRQVRQIGVVAVPVGQDVAVVAVRADPAALDAGGGLDRDRRVRGLADRVRRGRLERVRRPLDPRVPGHRVAVRPVRVGRRQHAVDEEVDLGHADVVGRRRRHRDRPGDRRAVGR